MQDTNENKSIRRRQLRSCEAGEADELAVQRTSVEACKSRKSADWKLAVAAWIKSRTQASNRWLTEHLDLGTPAALSRNLTTYRRRRQSQDPAWKRLISISAT